MPHGSSTIYLLALVRVLQCHAHRAAPTAVSEQSGLLAGNRTLDLNRILIKGGVEEVGREGRQ